MKRRQLVVIVAMLLGALVAGQSPPATARLSAYVEAFNSGDAAEMRRFIDENFAESALRETPTAARVARYESARARFRTMTVQKLVAERANQSFALVAGGNQQVFLMRATVEPTPPHKLLAIAMEMVDDPKNVVIPEPKEDDAALTLPGRGSSAGGGYSTAEDLLKYVDALATGRIVLPDVRGGLGIAGGAPGISSAVEWDSRTGYVVIVLTNLDPPAAVQVARRITGWLPD